MIRNRYFRIILTIFGVIHVRVDTLTSRYVVDPYLKIYGVFVTIVISSLNTCLMYFRLTHFSKTVLNTSSNFTKIIFLSDIFMWIVISVAIILRIISLSSNFCALFNEIYSKSENNIRNQRKSVFVKLFTFFTICESILANTFKYGLGINSCFITIANCLFVCQFLLGHFYENVLVENLINNQKMLLLEMKEKFSVDLIKFWLETHTKYRHLSKKIPKLFGFIKVIGVAASWIFYTFYWFYNYIISYNYIIEGIPKRKVFFLKFVCFSPLK